MQSEQIVAQQVIETERFDLRPLRRSDQGLIDLYAGDKRVAMMTTSIAHPLPPGSTEAFIARNTAGNPAETVWAIDGTKDEGAELKGLISLKKLDRHQSEIGYWVGPPFWNTGVASEALQALIAANPLGDTSLFASVFQDNPASAQVLTHCGFNYLGDAESYSVARGATVPTWTYSRKL
ncbi:GNAT family N-acetyltransferase [Albibacillus kandeliae]|uniref:GNAT family N-acetyltransferase n=1 Tax=Albibacillus kandeliae TaxID=2174228 RepID=UPI000D69F74E|nr:GNAT family N-acetyltransferase [Albibacillus kandeliae]